MPIRIFAEDSLATTLHYLCEDIWNLPEQMAGLELWLADNKCSFSPGSYVADIGFKIREDASGGGAALTSKMMRDLSELGMSLHLSEYPGFAE